MITIKSHGFKYARPHANFVYDVSYLKNPWRDEDVRSGRKTSQAFMEEQKEFQEVVDAIVRVVKVFESNYPDQEHVTAICCSAGEYRSPAVAKAISQKLTEMGISHHLDLTSQDRKIVGLLL